jgi:hypothetical protein
MGGQQELICFRMALVPALVHDMSRSSAGDVGICMCVQIVCEIYMHTCVF